MTAKTYRLGSSPLIYAPGIVAWAVNGYAFKRDRVHLTAVLTSGWNIPADAARALLSGAVPHTIEGETVVFTFPAPAAVKRGKAQRVAQAALWGLHRYGAAT